MSLLKAKRLIAMECVSCDGTGNVLAVGESKKLSATKAAMAVADAKACPFCGGWGRLMGRRRLEGVLHATPDGQPEEKTTRLRHGGSASVMRDLQAAYEGELSGRPRSLRQRLQEARHALHADNPGSDDARTSLDNHDGNAHAASPLFDAARADRRAAWDRARVAFSQPVAGWVSPNWGTPSFGGGAGGPVIRNPTARNHPGQTFQQPTRADFAGVRALIDDINARDFTFALDGLPDPVVIQRDPGDEHQEAEWVEFDYAGIRHRLHRDMRINTVPPSEPGGETRYTIVGRWEVGRAGGRSWMDIDTSAIIDSRSLRAQLGFPQGQSWNQMIGRLVEDVADVRWRTIRDQTEEAITSIANATMVNYDLPSLGLVDVDLFHSGGGCVLTLDVIDTAVMASYDRPVRRAALRDWTSVLDEPVELASNMRAISWDVDDEPLSRRSPDMPLSAISVAGALEIEDLCHNGGIIMSVRRLESRFAPEQGYFRLPVSRVVLTGGQHLTERLRSIRTSLGSFIDTQENVHGHAGYNQSRVMVSPWEANRDATASGQPNAQNTIALGLLHAEGSIPEDTYLASILDALWLCADVEINEDGMISFRRDLRQRNQHSQMLSGARDWIVPLGGIFGVIPRDAISVQGVGEDRRMVVSGGVEGLRWLDYRFVQEVRKSAEEQDLLHLLPNYVQTGYVC